MTESENVRHDVKERDGMFGKQKAIHRDSHSMVTTLRILVEAGKARRLTAAEWSGGLILFYVQHCS